MSESRFVNTQVALRIGVAAYLTNFDQLVHVVADIRGERVPGVAGIRTLVHTACERVAVPFDSSVPRMRKALPTTDPVTCMACIAEES